MSQLDPSEPNPPLPAEGIYRFILWLMIATVICGAILAIAGEILARDTGLSRLGTGMAVIGGVVYAFFRWLGRREARRQARDAADNPDTRSPDNP
jgi:uncharacterized membrane protein YvlD (DUF360 family)